jgi:branched-chain amino acid transport system substrate-binding protein
MAARPNALAVGASRRSVLTAGLLGAVAVTVDACSRRTNTAPAPQSLPRGDDLVFGACLELTGVGSVAGTAQQRALKIAQDMLNVNGVTIGGTLRKVQVTVRDTGSDPAGAAAIAQELVGQKALGIIGGGLASTSVAMAGVVEPRGVPLLSTSAAESVIRPQSGSRRFVFKLGPNASDVAGLMRTQLAHKSKVAILAEASDHGDAGVAAVTDVLRDLGRRPVAVEQLPQGARDYQSQATRVAAAGPDAVVIWAVSPVSGLAARSVRDAGFKGTLFFDAGAASDESLSPANRAAMENSYLVGPQILGGTPPAVNTPNAAASREFFDQYTRTYGAFSCLGVYAADALNLLTEAASRSGGSTPLRIRNELESTPYDGLAGAYVFSTVSHGGVQSDSLALFALQHGNWIQAS